jgi:3'(2'), 5'-bisphosphate nucleotidase
MPLEKELQAALTAARQASEAILAQYARFEAIPDARSDITTVADHEAQDIILACLKAEFPHDAFCAEEKTPGLAGVPATGSRLWVIDPIDGTRGFARKNGQFSVMIGFLAEGEIALGVVAEPVPGRVTFALRGQGCWTLDGGEQRRCRVSEQGDADALVLTQSHAKPGVPGWAVQKVRPIRVLETYSAGIKLAQVARGEADVYVNDYPNFNDWDICAGHVLVEEAGGRVTGLRGEELRYGLPGASQRLGLVASNGRVHEAVLQRLAQ